MTLYSPILVWIVSSEQLLAWVQTPQSVSDLNNFDALKCSTPDVDASLQICNGIPQNEQGLLSHCAFSDFPFFTCYGCPEIEPTPENPNPAQVVPSGDNARFRLPANCSTPFWDPIKGECLCTSDTCSFTDYSRSIGPNGANLTGGGTGGASTTTAIGIASTTAYIPFNRALPSLPPGVMPAVVMALIGAGMGTFEVLVRA